MATNPFDRCLCFFHFVAIVCFISAFWGSFIYLFHELFLCLFASFCLFAFVSVGLSLVFSLASGVKASKIKKHWNRLLDTHRANARGKNNRKRKQTIKTNNKALQKKLHKKGKAQVSKVPKAISRGEARRLAQKASQEAKAAAKSN
jgi:hypothetical protein